MAVSKSFCNASHIWHLTAHGAMTSQRSSYHIYYASYKQTHSLAGVRSLQTFPPISYPKGKYMKLQFRKKLSYITHAKKKTNNLFNSNIWHYSWHPCMLMRKKKRYSRTRQKNETKKLANTNGQHS